MIVMIHNTNGILDQKREIVNSKTKEMGIIIIMEVVTKRDLKNKI